MVKCEPYLLKGGYKEYRKFVKNFLLEEQFRYIVVTGPACCGKTQFLNKLAEKGEQILNLEDISEVNEPFVEDKSCPSQLYFESKIFHRLALELKTDKVVWVVYEKSRLPNLGKVFKYLEVAF